VHTPTTRAHPPVDNPAVPDLKSCRFMHKYKRSSLSGPPVCGTGNPVPCTHKKPDVVNDPQPMAWF